MRNVIYIFLFASICNSSCDKKQVEDDRSKKEFSLFNITGIIPNGWSYEKRKNSTDSETGYVFTQTQDTIFIDKGYYSNTLTEPDVKVLPISAKSQVTEDAILNKSVAFAEDSVFSRGVDVDRYRKQNVEFCKVDNYECKIVYPRIIGNGITGCYFENIGTSSDNTTTKLTIYGSNLKESEQVAMVDFIKSLKINKSKK